MGLSSNSGRLFSTDEGLTSPTHKERNVGGAAGEILRGYGSASIASALGMGTPSGPGPLWERNDPEDGLDEVFLTGARRHEPSGVETTALPDQLPHLIGNDSLKTYHMTATLGMLALGAQEHVPISA